MTLSAPAQGIWFPQWVEGLAKARLMEQVENGRRLGVSQLAVWKDALHWFFKASRSSPVNLKMDDTSQRAAPVVREKGLPVRSAVALGTLVGNQSRSSGKIKSAPKFFRRG
jgi:hypothetical protein